MTSLKKKTLKKRTSLELDTITSFDEVEDEDVNRNTNRAF